MYFFSVLDARTSATCANESNHIEVNVDLVNDETSAAYELLDDALEISNITGSRSTNNENLVSTTTITSPTGSIRSTSSNNENLVNTTTITSPTGSIHSTSSNKPSNSSSSTVASTDAGMNLNYKCKN